MKENDGPRWPIWVRTIAEFGIFVRKRPELAGKSYFKNLQRQIAKLESITGSLWWRAVGTSVALLLYLEGAPAPLWNALGIKNAPIVPDALLVLSAYLGFQWTLSVSTQILLQMLSLHYLNAQGLDRYAPFVLLQYGWKHLLGGLLRTPDIGVWTSTTSWVWPKVILGAMIALPTIAAAILFLWGQAIGIWALWTGAFQSGWYSPYAALIAAGLDVIGIVGLVATALLHIPYRDSDSPPVAPA